MLRAIRVVTKLSVCTTILLLAFLAMTSPARAQSTVAGGGAFTLVVKSDGTLWAFGLNNNGQLGDNTTTTRKSPQQVGGLTGIQAVAATQRSVVTLATVESVDTNDEGSRHL